MVGPSWNSSTCRNRATSSARELIGNWGARTPKPAVCNDSMTSLQQDPSAQAPWTSTMLGRPFTSQLPSWVDSVRTLVGCPILDDGPRLPHRTNLRSDIRRMASHALTDCGHRYSPPCFPTHVPLTCVDRSCTRTILMSLGSSL